MKASVFAFSKAGCKTAKRIIGLLTDCGFEAFGYTIERLSAAFELIAIPSPSKSLYERCFNEMDALVFVGACGIAVRSVAPFIRDKATDPAVIVVDETGRFVIPILSGHIGGANSLSASLAASLGATGVITTATDVNGRFSVDSWAAENGCFISDLKAAKAVSAAILERDVPLVSDLPILSALPNGVYYGSEGEVGIYITFKRLAEGSAMPFKNTLRLVPKVLTVGVGCRKGIEKARIAAAIEAVFSDNGLDIHAIKHAASIDIKSDESGLVDYFSEAGIPIDFFSAEQLKAVSGEFTPSRFVESVTGVDNVCERAAMLGSDRLIVKKTAHDGVTVAVALKKTEVRFE